MQKNTDDQKGTQRYGGKPLLNDLQRKLYLFKDDRACAQMGGGGACALRAWRLCATTNGAFQLCTNVRISVLQVRILIRTPREVGSPTRKVGLISPARHRIHAICFSRKK